MLTNVMKNVKICKLFSGNMINAIKELYNSGMSYMMEQRFSEAEAELNEAINICQNLSESEDSLESIGGIKHSIAYIYMESLHDYSRAKQLLLESLSIYEKLHERHSEEIINYSDSLNAIKSALSYLEEEENGSSNRKIESKDRN